MAAADACAEAVELRKLASELRAEGDRIERAKVAQAAHVLCASKGLAILQQKVRGWYEPLP